METRIDVALKGLICRDGRALLVRRSLDDELAAGAFEYPGGKLQFGEGLHDGLKREIREETGLAVSVGPLLYASTFEANPRRQVVVLAYRCRPLSEQVILSEEHGEYRWAPAEELRELLPPPLRRDFETYRLFEQLSCGAGEKGGSIR